MSRMFAALFVVVALIVIVAVLSLPTMLARRNTSVQDYKSELAAWHVRWARASSPGERRSMVLELDAIAPPAASIELLDQHRIYAEAHRIYSEADDLVATVLAEASYRDANGSDPLETCSEVTQAVRSSPEGTEAALDTASATCTLFNSASRNLVVVRSLAVTGWLEDEINELSP